MRLSKDKRRKTKSGYKTNSRDLFWEVDENYTISDQEVEKKLVVNTAKGKITEDLPMMSIFNKNKYRFFVVSSINEVAYSGNLAKFKEGKKYLSLSIRFTIRCDFDRESTLLKNFHNTSDFNGSILKKMKLWFNKHFNNKRSLIEDFDENIKGVIDKIRDNAKKLGIHFTELKIEIDNAPESHQIVFDQLKLTGKNSKKTVPFYFRAELQVIEKVKAVLHGSNDKIQNWIKTEIKEYVGKELVLKELLDGESQKQLKKHLNSRLRRKGRELTSVRFKHKLDSVKPHLTLSSTKPITVKLKDYTGPLELSYEVRLVILEGASNLARLSDKTYLSGKIEDQIHQTFKEKVSLEEFSTAINAKPASKLMDALNTILKEYGREVVFIKLIGKDLGPIIEEFLELNHTINCNIENTKVDISNELHLRLQSKVKFRRSGVINLQERIKKVLKHNLRAVLMELSFMGMETKSDWKNDVREKVKLEIQSFGYEVKHLILHPQTWWSDFKRDGFNVTIGKNEQGKEIEFVTKYNGKVKLSVNISGRVKDVQYISEYIRLKDAQAFEKKLKNIALQATREILHDIAPQDFYVYFEHPKDGKKGKAVRDLIIQEIKSRLKENFGIKKGLIILPEPQETQLTKRVKKLLQGFHKFSFRIHGFDLKIKGKFKVVSIDFSEVGWLKFLNNSYPEGMQGQELLDISEHIKGSMQEKIRTATEDHWDGSIDSELRKHFSALYSVVQQEILRSFGLIIEIVLSDIAKRLKDKYREKKIKSRYDKGIDDLENERLINEALNKSDLDTIKLLGDRKEEIIKGNRSLDNKRLKKLNEKLKKKKDRVKPKEKKDKKKPVKLSLKNVENMDLLSSDKEKNQLNDEENDSTIKDFEGAEDADIIDNDDE